MAAEEQALEIEALQSIFEEGKEFCLVSETEFVLKLLPYPAGEEENHVGVSLHITYTPEYPETAPTWELEDNKGLSDEKFEALRNLVEETVNASLGMAMVYTVAEACQDWLKENNVKALSMHEEMMQRLKGGDGQAEGEEDEEGEGDDDDDDYDENAPGKEEEEWKGLADKTLCDEKDRITPESFAAWKLGFDEEMIAAGVLKRDGHKAKTGKMIFLETKEAQDQATGGENGAGTGNAGGEPGVLVYDAALFGEEDADDLDDLED